MSCLKSMGRQMIYGRKLSWPILMYTNTRSMMALGT